MLQTMSSKQSVSTISSKGQITLPVVVRRHLGVDINDKVAFMIEHNGEVKVTQMKYPTIASLSGAAGKLKQPLPWKQVLKIAREDRLKEKYG